MGKHTRNKTLITINRALLSGLFRGLGALTWPMLRGVSSFIAWMAHDVVKYRVGICLDNMRTSFPDKPEEEIRKMAKEFYRFLADYFIETVKLGSMSPQEMKKRMAFENIEEVNADLRSGKNVSILLGHFCNWEWVSSMPLWLDLSTGAVPCQIYHPLSDIAADEVFGKIRSRFGATNLPMSTSAKTLMEMNRSGIPTITGYIADQTPAWNAVHHWLPFLHHDTAVYVGPEKISRKIHASVYYIDMRRPERNRYVGRFIRMTPDATGEESLAITRRYFDMLQTSIETNPPYWLWTHRRWKHKRSNNDQ